MHSTYGEVEQEKVDLIAKLAYTATFLTCV
jgi:hypothetical protein